MQEGWAKARETSPPDAPFGKRLYDAIEAAPLQYLAAPALGLAALWAFMALAAGDTFAAYRAEQQFIGEYKVSEIIRPWHFFSDFFTTDLHLHGYLDSALDRLVFIAFLASLPLAWRRLDRPLFAMTLLLGIVPLFGSFLAYTRLVMSAFGLFVAYAAVARATPRHRLRRRPTHGHATSAVHPAAHQQPLGSVDSKDIDWRPIERTAPLRLSSLSIAMERGGGEVGWG